MLSHKEMETALDEFMESKDWLKAKVQKGYNDRCYPDRIYTKGADILVFELKPTNVNREGVYKGIGQALWYLSYQVKPYLVIPESWVLFFKSFSHLPYLGILQYSERTGFSIYQKAAGRDLTKLKEFFPLEIVKLSRPFLWNFLKRLCSEDGLYSLDFIEGSLEQTYPKVSFYRQTIARVMISMGYGRGHYNPETMEANYAGETFFHIILNRNLRGHQ